MAENPSGNSQGAGRCAYHKLYPLTRVGHGYTRTSSHAAGKNDESPSTNQCGALLVESVDFFCFL